VNSIIISNDDSLAIAVMVKSQNEVLVALYDLSIREIKEGESCYIKDTITINGLDTIKAFQVVQNAKGNRYCLPYFDSGKFKIRVFSKMKMEICQVDDLNKQLGISEDQAGIATSNGSSISAIFIDDHTIFINLYDFD
jgi:hypothetical protein